MTSPATTRPCIARQTESIPYQQLGCQLSAMPEGVFKRFSAFIYRQCGIKMPPSKKGMLEGRLRKRLHHLGLESFEAYCDYLLSSEGAVAEHGVMLDLVTTNKTDFFRESGHFDFLVTTALPELIENQRPTSSNPIRVWSAGCSSGEEPYTLAMVLSEFSGQSPGFTFSVLATDLCSTVLHKAARGVYEHERAQPIPLPLRRKYLLRSKDRNRGLVRIVPELRACVTFRKLNFMDEDYGIPDGMAVIFCRNVIIYFDRATQERFVKRLSRYLMPGGFLFMGHSETLHGLDVDRLQTVGGGMSIYRKR